MVNSVRPATNPNAPRLPFQTGEPIFKDPPGTYRSPIPGFRPSPDPLGFPLDKKNQAQTPTQAPSGNLSNWLRQWNSGHRILSPEMYDYYKGDDLLKEMQKFDPNARWRDTFVDKENSQPGRELEFDPRKLPNAMGGKLDWMYARPAEGWGELRNPQIQGNDPVYGRVTHAANTDVKGKTPWWMQAAPVVIGGLPMLAGGAAMGGLGRLAMGAVQGLGNSGGRFNPMSLVSGAAGMIPGVGDALRIAGPAMTAYGLYNSFRRNNNG